MAVHSVGPRSTRPRAQAAQADDLGQFRNKPYAQEILTASRKYNLPPRLLASLIQQESGFNAKAGSPAGAQGLTQLMPATARSLGVSNALDPKQAIDGGA